MRRKDREMTDRREIVDILGKCDVVRVGLRTPDYPYIVPMNFGYEDDGENLTIWFHSAHEGRKLDLIRSDSRVGFEADCGHKLLIGDFGCGCSMEYESISGYGDITICAEKDIESKQRGAKAVMRQYIPDQEFNFTAEQLAMILVMRLDVKYFTGKRKK